MDDEQFVRELAAALPEAFAGLDLEAEYFNSWELPGQQWMTYTALGRAREWVESCALTVDRRAQAVEVRREAALRRFFAFVESSAGGADWNRQNLVMIELFEGTPWIENLIQMLGPETIALLRRAQMELAPYNAWIGRWEDDAGS